MSARRGIGTVLAFALVWLCVGTMNAHAQPTLYYVYTDQINTPRSVMTTAAVTVWKWENLDPYGANAPNQDPDGDSIPYVFNLRFQGQYFDKETGTHYNYFRTYDPAQGRYVESDQIGLIGGINTYGYVGGNPLTMIDPQGNLAWWAIPIITGAIGAIAGSSGNYLVQKYLYKNCDISWAEVINAGLWGAAAGAAMPFFGTTGAGAAGIGAAANLGQYYSGNLLSGQSPTGTGAFWSAAYGALGGAAGGVFSRPAWYGSAGTALPGIAASQAATQTLYANTGFGNSIRNLIGGFVGNIDPQAQRRQGCLCSN